MSEGGFAEVVGLGESFVIFGADEGRVVEVGEDVLDVFVFRVRFEVLEFEFPEEGLVLLSANFLVNSQRRKEGRTYDLGL